MKLFSFAKLQRLGDFFEGRYSLVAGSASYVGVVYGSLSGEPAQHNTVTREEGGGSWT